MAEVKKQNWFKRTLGSISKWFRGMKSELKKVVWPSRSQVVNNSVIVIVVSVVYAVIIGLFDYLAGLGITGLFSLFN